MLPEDGGAWQEICIMAFSSTHYQVPQLLNEHADNHFISEEDTDSSRQTIIENNDRTLQHTTESQHELPSEILTSEINF